MKALVTGGNGFVGQLLVKKLLNNGNSVRLLSRSTSPITIDDVEIVIGDLTSDRDLSEIAIGCDVIFHCAGEIANQDKMFALNVEGTRKLIDAVHKGYTFDRKPKHWVQLSSVGAYGPSVTPGAERIVDELSDSKPVGTYEITKTLADEMIMESVNNIGMTYTILRPSNIVGTSMSNQSFFGLLKAIEKRRFFYVGSKKTISTYIHVDDVVDALIICSVNKKACNQIFNLSNDCNLSEIVDSISHHSGFNHNFLCVPEKPLRIFVGALSGFFRLPLTKNRIDSLVSRTTYPCTKIKDMLGFSPKKSIPEFSIEYSRYLNG
ncbi:NAD(P)-dependent oxidoreductase [Polynucleobacter sp. AM-26B4]|uniref:NAD-dependent epimerase/dehydratase family protein n=1 Tax=Polynucleobacter sp. AM-26B4 TaxID=2689103 RepID=UPI001C0DBEF7|nr:NAD(P)-dependent oxidoreductase [Polynucleobacter sp. AM-26B4]MBU3585126.1 NAD(P)-dependent oxidoreductase [Polynucleobacter sp. AM-26B4]